MRALWYLLHVFGYSIWIGGALAAMAVNIASKREAPEHMGLVVRLQAAIYRSLIGPGALASTVSGFVLTLQMYNQATAVGLSHGLLMMQGLGLIAAILVVVIALPTSAKLARLEPVGPSAPAFHGLRKRLVLASMSAGTLAFAALVAGAFYRYQ
jgi:hypothetical protein